MLSPVPASSSPPSSAGVGLGFVPNLVLEPVMGPPIAPVDLTPPGRVTLGRLPECEVQLPESEKTVSRKHCVFEARTEGSAPGWYLTDCGSRHGTIVNSEALAPHMARMVRAGDTVRLGPWVFRVQSAGANRDQLITTTTPADIAGEVFAVTQVDRGAIDRRRLELLILCAKQIQAASDERALAECVVDALLEGTGYPRVAIVRPTSLAVSTAPGITGSLDVLATRTARHSAASFQFSRSLVAAACTGQMVQMKFEPDAMPAMSIMSVGMTTAMAVPVFLDRAVTMCFYLDARRDEPPVHDDAAAFCQAIAEMSSLSLANMQRTRLNIERTRLGEQMEAAMQIQRQILPPTEGDWGAVAYAMELRPGRFVAGDLFDIFRLDDRRVAFFIGDVAGKGVPAAILMATTQSYLNAALRSNADPAAALTDVNRHLMTHAPEGKFVSLWAGVLDTATGLLRFCDAGHGYALLAAPGEPPADLDLAGRGVPLRVLDEPGYVSTETVLRPGTRVVLYSDGVVEQPAGGSSDVRAEAFGAGRIIAAIASAENPQHDVTMLIRAVQRHAAADVFHDDLTIASVQYVRGT